MKELSSVYKISLSVVNGIIPEVCDALIEKLRDDYIALPHTRQKWLTVQSGFYVGLQFPNCLGVLNVKRVKFDKLAKPGIAFMDHEGGYSVMMLAVVDAFYRFLYIHVGGVGQPCDFWNRCSLNKEALCRNILQIPPPNAIPYTQRVCRSVFISNYAFPHCENILKPYQGEHLTHEEKVFNHRLSRAGNSSENAFGLLSRNFRIYQQPILISPSIVHKVVFATVVLHNYLCCKTPNEYGCVDQSARQYEGAKPTPLEDTGAIRDITLTQCKCDDVVNPFREQFTYYFNKEGRIEWQERMAKLL